VQTHLLLLGGFLEKRREAQQPLQASRGKVLAVVTEGGQVKKV